MSRRDTILSGIARLRSRWWRVHLLRHSVQAFFYLALVGAFALLVFESVTLTQLLIAIAISAVVCGGIAAFLGRPSEAALAKAFDDRSGLKDRVSSTVELLGMEETGNPMVEALADEAVAAAKDLQPAAVYPVEVPREGRWILVPALLVGAVLLLQGSGDAKPQPDTILKDSVKSQLEKLEELLSQEKREELSPRQKEILEELLELKASLDGQEMDRRDTMAEVAKALEDMKQAYDLEKKKEQELKQLFQGLNEKTGDQELNDMVMNNQFASALEKVREELEELREKLEQMKKDGASPEEMKALEEMIADLEEMEAKLMELLQLDMNLEMMGEAMDFLAHWDGELGELGDLEPGELVEPGEP